MGSEEIRSMLLPETSPENNILIQMRSIVDEEKKKDDETTGVLTNKLMNFESKFIQPIFGASANPRRGSTVNH
jgi:predicted KAP-like P-loop ATPase